MDDIAMPESEHVSTQPPISNFVGRPTGAVSTLTARNTDQAAGNRWDSGTIPFLASLVLHVSTLLLLACLAVRADLSAGPITLEVDENPGADSELTISTQLDLEPAESAALELQQPEATTQELSESLADVQKNLEIPVNFGEGMIDSGVASLAATLTSTSSAVQSSGDVIGDGSGSSFFGSYAKGKRFVYVLDSSRSMNGERWRYACSELLQSIKQLSYGQEFFVICFDYRTSPMLDLKPAEVEFYESEPKVVKQLRTWLRKRSLGPETMPAQALMVALSMKPDAIFLLSDGELRDDSINILRSVNPYSSTGNQVPIHVIHLFSPEGRATLELLARENGGTFVAVAERD